jgi:hypothetical protein
LPANIPLFTVSAILPAISAAARGAPLGEEPTALLGQQRLHDLVGADRGGISMVEPDELACRSAG